MLSLASVSRALEAKSIKRDETKYRNPRYQASGGSVSNRKR